MDKAKWITRNLPKAMPCGVADAKWVWAWEYCRIHAKKEFVLAETPVRASAYFECDNAMDLYINGNPVPLKDNRADVSEFVKEGKNIIAVRAYQTDTAERFLSAFRGGVTAEMPSGKSVCVPTDSTWKQLRLCWFGENSEIEGWQTESVGEHGREERFEHLKEFTHHPSVLRRASVFKKRFNLKAEPVSAVMRGSAYGLWQPYINGKTVQYRLMPGTMEGRKEYQEFSVRKLLHAGENEVCVILGNGWYNCECFGILDAKQPSFIGEIEVAYADGEKEIVATDESWLAAESRIYEDDLQYGERVDARISETAEKTAVCADCNTALVKQDYPLMGVEQRIAPQTVSDEDGKTVFDFGYNFSGRASFKFYNTVAGQKITIRYYEFINNDGEYNLHTYSDVFYPCESDKGGKARGAVKNLDFYIARGAECEEYEPIFTYTGLRYVIIEGLSDGQKCEAEGMVIGALLKDNGTLSSACGYPEQLWDMTYKTWRGNVFSGPTDCPSREKNYWNGDMQLFANTACWCSDCSEFLARWTEFGRKIEYGVYGWEDEEYVVPWVLYKFYGDSDILRRKYDVILRLMRDRGVFNGDVLPKNPHSPYNDHLTCGVNIDKQLFSDMYYCLMIGTACKIADVIGKSTDKAVFEEKYAESLAAFRERYRNNPLLTENPASIVLALAFKLYDGAEAEKLAQKLNNAVCENGYTLITGFHATRYILDVLCDYGYAETAWKLVKQGKYPSWRYIAETGAATFTETWHGMDTGETEMSMNHFTPGAFACWFFEYLGGIRVEKCGPGFKELWLEPVFLAEVGSFAVSANTAHGKVKSAWQSTKNGFEYRFEIPHGITAKVCIDGEIREFSAGKHCINV